MICPVSECPRLGGDDTLNTAGFTGIDFKDTRGDLNGSSVENFGATDVIDLTNIPLGGARVAYTPASSVGGVPAALVLSDGAFHGMIDLMLGVALPVGYFATGSDGADGTDVTYVVVGTDAFAWSNPLGGSFALAGNWQDTTLGTTATAAPSYGNALTIAGGTSHTDITDNGDAASLTTSGDILLRGSLALGAMVAGVSGDLTQSGTLALDGDAGLTLSGTATIAGLVEVGGGSTLTAAGGVTFGNEGGDADSLVAIDGSTAQFADVTSIGVYANTSYLLSTDSASSIEFGTAGDAARGVLTVDNGVTANLIGTIAMSSSMAFFWPDMPITSYLRW